MLLVYLTSGVCVEVPDAVSAEQRGARLVFLDADGVVVSSFQAQYVSAFTSDPVMVEAIEEELGSDAFLSKLIEQVSIASFDDFFALGSLERIEERLTQETVII